MIWLYVAIWLTNPQEYKIVSKIGPFDTKQQCWAAGALAANSIQSKDTVSNALGACVAKEPKFLDMKSMWEMVCASLERESMCWWKNGEFIDPTKE